MQSEIWRIRIPRREISYLRFLLEGYEGLAGLRTVHGQKGILEISVPPGRQAEWWMLLQDLKERMLLDILLAPPGENPGAPSLEPSPPAPTGKSHG
jgi:hypothetical protein